MKPKKPVRKVKPVKGRVTKMPTMKMVVAIPFTGLGLYGGFRGNRWLRNRIAIFKEFTLRSLLNQTDQDFVCWFQWRPEERGNKHVGELESYLRSTPLKFIFTYGGVCMYDDKYEDSIARERLFESIRISMMSMYDFVPDCDQVIHLLQPSDDCYASNTVELVKKTFENNECNAVSFVGGYLCNYNTMQVVEYNPKTNPPFAAIRFPREAFLEPDKHLKYIALKTDTEKYPAGTPLPSHEYLSLCFNTAYFDFRGFLVGTHGENISTHFNHPYGGNAVDASILEMFGIKDAPKLKLPISVRKWAMRRLPYRVQRKLRYVFGEKFWAHYYSWIRN